MGGVEFLEELIECGADLDLIKKSITKAKEMEEDEKIEFACDVYYNYGSQENSFRATAEKLIETFGKE
jgi:hypothetical protein